jgi:BlaI family transcriptional regulator, penicillinase repressor
MTNKKPNRPTDSELEILSVLWERGPSTVRQIFELLGSRKTGYTTVLKTLQIMTEKGLVQRDESQRSHIYRPSEKPEKTRQRLVGELLEKAFAGATDQMVMQALKAKKVTKNELAEIKKMIEQLQQKKQ